LSKRFKTICRDNCRWQLVKEVRGVKKKPESSYPSKGFFRTEANLRCLEKGRSCPVILLGKEKNLSRKEETEV